MAGAVEDRRHGVGAELAFPDGAAQPCGRCRIAQRRPVGPCFPRGLEGLGGGEDACGGRKVGAADAAVIAAAVEALVVAKHEGRDSLALAAHCRQRTLAMVGMKPGRIGLARGQRTGPLPGRDRHRQLAEIVGVARPAELTNVRFGKPHLLGRGVGQGRDGVRMAEGERHPHVDHVGYRQIGFLARLLIEDRMRKRLQRQDRPPLDFPLEAFHQALGIGEEDIGQRRLIRPIATLGDHRDHRLVPIEPGQHDGILGECHQTDGELHRVALEAVRQPMPVPALIDLAEIFAELVRKTDPRPDALRHLAVAGENGNAHVQRIGETALDEPVEVSRRRIGEDAIQRADKGFDELRMVAEVDAGEVLAHGDLIAKRRRQEVRVGIAADIAKQGLVVDIAALMIVEARSLGEPHRQHAAPQRKIPRLTGGQVRRIGQRHQKVSASNCRCRHLVQSP